VPTAILDRLRALVGPANLLTGVDVSPYVIEGRTPTAAAFPASLEDVSGVLTLAHEARVPVTPWGGGTAMAVGAPPARLGLVLGMNRLNRVIEHEPGDLTATVEAGATISTVQTTLRARGQWLSLDPGDADRATIGGVLATNASGSRRHLYGTARDLLIGVTVVCADGSIVKGGGKVVKNVAGYDLPKLFVGSYGTLAVIVSATFKLRPVPEAESLVAVPLGTLKDCGLAVRAVMSSDLLPTALDVLDGDAARAVGIDDDRPVLVVGFDGLPDQVAWQRRELLRLVRESGGKALRDLPATAWEALPNAATIALGRPTATVRMSVLPARVADVMEQGAESARAAGLRAAFSAHAGVGSVMAALVAEQDAAARVVHAIGEWRHVARAGAGHAVVESAPLAVKEQVDVWDQPGAALRIMQRIKAQLDPHGILNPGRYLAL
jgi:glycolate oxidase FAD binding subunit